MDPTEQSPPQWTRATLNWNQQQQGGTGLQRLIVHQVHMEVGMTEPCAARALRHANSRCSWQRSQHVDHSAADLGHMCIAHDSWVIAMRLRRELRLRLWLRRKKRMLRTPSGWTLIRTSPAPVCTLLVLFSACYCLFGLLVLLGTLVWPALSRVFLYINFLL